MPSSPAGDRTEAQSAENWLEIEFCEISIELYLAPVIHLHATETPHYSICAEIRGDLNLNHTLSNSLANQSGIKSTYMSKKLLIICPKVRGKI